jgi:hypothetical protein
MLSLLRTCALLVLLAAAAPAAPTEPSAPPRPPEIPALPWEKRSDWLSVKDVKPPAAGDGTADDTGALQAALDTVRDGSTVYLPPGTYRITRTIAIKGPVTGVSLIGHGRGTRIVWDGEPGGRMLWSNGAAHTRYVGLVWDGRGKAAIGIDHDGKNRFETEVRHQHEAFLGFTDAGIRIGRDQKLASAEILYESCLFEECERGVAFTAFNDYDNTFDGCEFRRCGTAVHDEHGNFYVRNCRFEGSRKADLFMRSEHGSSVRRSVSVGSHRFADFGAGVAPFAIEDCRVEGWKAPDGAVVIGGAPALVFDCVFAAPPNDHPPIRVVKGAQRLVLSNNAAPGAPAVVKAPDITRVVEIPPGKSGGCVAAAPRRFLQERARVPSKVFDAKRDFGAKGDGRTDDTAAVQRAIDAARAQGSGALAYLPTGAYVISAPLLVTGSGYAFGGSGFRTGLVWKGPEGGVLVDVRDAKDVTLEHINIGSHDAGAMNNGVDVLVTASGPSLLHLDGVSVFGMYQKQSDRKGLLCRDLPRGAVVHALQVEGNLRFLDSARARVLIGTSYEGSVTVEGKKKERDGLIGFMMRLCTICDRALYVKDNQSVAFSDFYVEQADHHTSLHGGPGDPEGRVTLMGAKSQLPKPGNTLFDIQDYGGTVVFGPNQLYTEPKPAGFVHAGTRPLALVFLADFFYNTSPDLRLAPSATPAFVACEGPGSDERVPTGTLERIARALDDLREIGRLDVELNHPAK